MKKDYIFAQNIRLSYQKIKRTIRVSIGSFTVLALSVASVAVPFKMSIEPISTFHTEIFSPTNLPADFSERIIREHNAEIRKTWNNELDEIASLGEDWDGEGSAAVQPEAVDFIKSRILGSNDFSLDKLSEMYPTPFGSICLEWTVRDGYVNAEIASTGMAFFHKAANEAKPFVRRFAEYSDDLINSLKSHLV